MQSHSFTFQLLFISLFIEVLYNVFVLLFYIQNSWKALYMLINSYGRLVLCSRMIDTVDYITPEAKPPFSRTLYNLRCDRLDEVTAPDVRSHAEYTYF